MENAPRCLTLYITLIGEGQRADLARWINRDLLVGDWPKIRMLTARVLVRAWEKSAARTGYGLTSAAWTRSITNWPGSRSMLPLTLGLILAGGYAISAHGLTSRPSRDLDFVTQSSLPLAEVTERLAAVCRTSDFSTRIIESADRVPVRGHRRRPHM